MRSLSVILLIGAFFISSPVKSQKFTDAKKYAAVIDKQHSKVAKDLLSFSNAVSKNKKAKDIASLNKSLLIELNKSQLAIAAMPPFKANKDFKDSAAAFMKNCFNLINVDYTSIATATPAAQKSPDNMKDLLAAKVTANEELKALNGSYDTALQKFYRSANKDAFSGKFQQAIDVNVYYNKVYLLYFKTFNAEFYLLESIKKRDGNSVQQNKKIVYQSAQDGLKELDTTKAFVGDNALVKKCQALLTFYSDESDTKMDKLSDYFSVAKDFGKTRSEYEKKQTHTKDEVKEYKKAVSEFNKALNGFNNTSHDLDHKREKALKSWNKAMVAFLDSHLPNK
jgi:hypothetical protein